MTHETLLAILADIKIFDRLFIATPTNNGGWHLQVTYVEADVDTGKVEQQYSRKWFIEPDATESDVVDTVYAAVRRSYKHVVQEHFTYKGKRVFSPHFTIDQRLAMCEGGPRILSSHATEQRMTEQLIAGFERLLRSDLFSHADELLLQLDETRLPPAALLGALTITFHAKDKLKNRDAFLVRAETKLRAELGDAHTEDLLKHRR